MERERPAVDVEILGGPWAGRTGRLVAADLVQATVALDDRWVQVPLEDVRQTAALARWAFPRRQPST